MKPYQKFMTGALAALFLTSPLLAENMKFPQGKDYGTRPSGSVHALGNVVKAQYDRYVNKWYKEISSGGYIESKDTDGKGETVSEAHGYGMMIFAIMGDQARFDEMVKYYENHKVSNLPLMNWIVGAWDYSGSATDGDLDIAYALLLAYKQWGNEEYLTKALKVSDGILAYDLNSGGTFLACGSSYTDRELTRPSDWMAGHLRAFAKVDNGSSAKWNSIADEMYNRYNKFVANNEGNGLISDFVKNGGPANGGEHSDLDYYTNAARVPLRFAMDYARNKNATNTAALKKITDRLVELTGGDATKMKRGYKLNGTAMSNDNSLVFLAPYGAGLICNEDQALINSAWNELQAEWTTGPSTPSFDDALKLLSMIVMTGNWWTPSDEDTYEPPYVNTDGVVLDNFGNAYGDDPNQCELGAVNGVYWGDQKYGGTNGDTTYYHGGGYWYAYAGEGATVKTIDGDLLSAETEEASANGKKIVKDNRLDIKFEISKDDDAAWSYAAFEVPFISNVFGSKDKEAEARYVDLTKLTGITIDYYADNPLQVVIATKDQLETVTPDDGGWVGSYILNLPASTEMKRATFSIEDLKPESGSPLDKAIKDKDPNITGLKDAKAFVFQVPEGGSNGKGGASVHLQVEDIILNGVTYEDFGIRYREATPVPVGPTTVKQNLKIKAVANADNISLQLPATKAGVASVALYTVSGRQVASSQTSVDAGMNNMTIDTRNIARGIYLMRLNINGAVSSAQIRLMD